MKKTIAVIAMTGLIACGCSHFRHRESNTGGTYDNTQMNSGSNSSTNSNSSTTGTSGSSTSSSSTDSSTSNPSDKTPR